MQSSDVLEQWLSDVEAAMDSSDRFSDGEREFISSIREQFDRSGFLSEAQQNRLEKIYFKA